MKTAFMNKHHLSLLVGKTVFEFDRFRADWADFGGKLEACNFGHINKDLRMASILWVMGKQNSHRCDAAKRGVPSGTILFAYMIFIEN